MRLIDADELKNAIENLVVGGAEGLKNYYKKGSMSDQNAWIGGVYDAWELIDNAPTVEIRSYEQGFRDGYSQCITDNEERRENNRLFQKGGTEE